MKGVFRGLGFAAVMMMGAVAAAAGEPLRGPEAWLELIGGNVRKDGLRCDLESLKETGFSGVQLFHIGRQAEAWPGCEEQIPCLSEKWNDLMAFLGSECKRLGLNLTVQNCPGWSQSGGPWIAATNAMRDVEMSRLDFFGGKTPRLPEIPTRFRDADSDWRDIALLAFPTPVGDESADDRLRPVAIETNGYGRVFTFDRPVTVRTIKLPGLVKFTETYAYHAPWMHVTLEALPDDGAARKVLDTDLPVYCWRDYVETLTLACDETTARRWRYTFRNAYPILTYMPAINLAPRYPEPTFHVSARLTNWEAMSGRVLRSIMRNAPPKQSPGTIVKGDSIVDLSGRRRADGTVDWTVPEGRWTLIRIGHCNSKRVNAPAPKEATGWECDKLAPEGIEAHFNGYIKKLADGPLKGVIRGMLVDSWECWCQTWTPRMEQYFREANGYELRLKLPMLFGWVVDSPEKTQLFLNDWRRTIGDLITKNYYGKMAELAHAAGLKAYYESAFGDIVCGDLLEYWKYADDPMCEFWSPYAPREVGHVGSVAFKAMMPCISAAHVYGKRRVVAEAFTGWGLSWMEDFRGLRDVANRHFARGVTHLAYQSYTHAPVPDALPPGGCMNGGNGTPFTRLQTWWKHMPAFNGWITRCEERLEKGRPVEDVLWYLGDAADHKPDDYFAFPEGFRADYLNRDVLLNRLSLGDGLFTIPEGTAWRVLWVPDTLYMRPDTKAKLDQLAAAGGTVVFGGKDALVRALAGLRKDVATSPSLGDGPSEDFMWLHRQDGAVDRYFVAAGTNGYRGVVTFRAKGPVSVYDPVTEERTAWRNGTEFVLGPSQSVFVEFDPATSASTSTSTFTFNLSSPWKLSFTPGWDAPETVTLDKPVPWCEIPGFSPAAKAYSGTVVYGTTFEAPAGQPQKAVLDLGRVETVAVVWVNGQKVRTLWCEPYACDISKFVRKGRNDLRIEVTGVWRNRVVYDRNQPEKDRKTWILYRPGLNPPLDAPLIPQGLLGPVTVRWNDRKASGVGLQRRSR